MSGVLHPVGPEPARTYWVRRGILLAVVLLVAVGIVLAVASLTKAAVATAPPPVIAVASTPSASSSSTGLEPSASSETPGAPAPSPSTSPSTSASAATSASAQPSSGSSTTPSPEPTDAPASPSALAGTGTPKPTTTPTTKAAPVATPDCEPADLDVTLTGERSLSPGENNVFKLSLVNGDAATCLASVTDKNFELKIYSGKDRIWSSRDCTKSLKAFDKKLGSQAAAVWTMTWNGERSVAGKNCKVGGETPRAGTYWATAQLKGADPVQLRMIIS